MGRHLDALVERSRRIGADPALVVHGGGNTSVKVFEDDLLGQPRAVLRIKGSGADLRTAAAADFPGVLLEPVLALRERTAMSDEEMTAHLARCLVDPGARRPSIETLLHAFLPARHVDHVHADAIVALTKAADRHRVVAEALGEGVAVVDYVRPGFTLSRLVADLAGRDAVVLAHHGLVTWGETSEESLERTLALVTAARAYLAQRTAGRRGRRAPDGTASDGTAPDGTGPGRPPTGRAPTGRPPTGRPPTGRPPTGRPPTSARGRPRSCSSRCADGWPVTAAASSTSTGPCGRSPTGPTSTRSWRPARRPRTTSCGSGRGPS